MPEERPYTPQLGPARPTALPQASPGDFGAGVGTGIAQLGGVLHESEVKAYRIEKALNADQERADFAKKFAEAKLAWDKERVDKRITAGPGAAGYTKSMQDTFDASAPSLFESITDDSVRREAQAQVDGYRGNFVGDAYQYEAVKRAQKIGTDTETKFKADQALIRTSDDPKAYLTTTVAGDEYLNSLTGVDDATREGLRRDMHAGNAKAYVERVIDTNPGNAVKMIDSGMFTGILDSDQLDRLRGEAQSTVRVNDSQARAAASQAATVEKDQLAASGTVLDGGAGSYSDRLALSQRYSSLGDQSKAAEWAGKAEAFKASAGSASWTLPQLDRRITELQGKQNTKGLTGPEGFELKGLIDRRSATSSNLNQDGGALLQLSVATGKPIAPLVPGDQQSMRARSAAAIAAAARYGRPQIEPLLQSEMAGFKDLIGNGTGGKQEVLSILAGFGDARAIVGAAQQLTGGQDGAFVMAARVMGYPAGQQIARDILAGQDAIKTRGAKWEEQKAQTDFASWYGTALRDAGPDYRRDVFDAAKALYAARRGDVPYNPGYFADAVESVMGRSKSGAGVRGGVAHVGGLSAPGGWVVIAPPTMAPDEMMRRFARGATYDYAKAAGGTAPVWTDGHPFKRSDLNMMVPRLLANGRYGFVDPRNGGLIHDNRGGVYSVDLDLLPGLVRRGK